MNSKFILFLCMLFILASCKEVPDDFYEKNNIPETSGKEVFDGDPEPLRPPLEKSIEGLYGVDSDNDGVRDDVEIWINRTFETLPQRQFYKELTRRYSKQLAMTEKGNYQTKQYYEEFLKFYICGILAFESDVNDAPTLRNFYNKKYEPIFLNSKLRITTFYKFITKGENPIISSSPPSKEYPKLSRHCPWGEEVNQKLLKYYMGKFKNHDL